ncbi:conserved hypothetical protein [Methanococcus vannielii SB]|uniref:Uncharacterized protein n=1 Tax=Methanococcus vannielii (strain ATCC 35089 / DSM 1224 / JCM 13029 / OCM 148 / SB) TaxID=406327 RepID=A6UPQ5_METVS|nr:pyrimidine dimer DNA glycosylase/endonuclease V [Methanococcus vannielii]ABR54477.1 conserved hypothetical protein [Methanococcus vannielii SB]
MQLFILDNDPKRAAKMHCDKHVVKMTLETAQILSTVHHLHNSIYAEKCYKKTHEKHPCVLWASKTRKNYEWALELFKELLKEYTYRYKKIHKSSEILPYLKHNPVYSEKNELTPFAKAIPELYWEDDAVLAYRKYYILEKSKFCKWSKRKVPEWYLKGLSLKF